MLPRILLLQARHADDPAKAEERASFAARARLPLDAFISHDLLLGPPTLDDLHGYDALMIGGAGEFDVSKRNLPFFQDTLDFLVAVVDEGFPTFASCFGFQLMVEALGGKIIPDPERTEVGTFEIMLTDAGREDELFRCLPRKFDAQLGHKERAAYLPSGAVNLATSELCPYQALRIPGKPIWATQFHPELSLEDNRARFLRYMRVYAGVLSEEELEATLRGFRPSPHTHQLIPRFLELIRQ